MKVSNFKLFRKSVDKKGHLGTDLECSHSFISSQLRGMLSLGCVQSNAIKGIDYSPLHPTRRAC